MKGLYLLVSALLVTSFAFGQAGNYRSIGSGPWGTPATWERDADSNGSFEESPSTVAPTTPATAGTILIRNTHVVNVAANVSVDQVTVAAGGSLVVNATRVLTLANGAGDEITIAAESGIIPAGSITMNGTLAFGTLPPNRTVQVSGDFNNNGTISGSSVLKLFFLSGSHYYHQFADGGIIPPASWHANSSVHIVGYTSGNSTPPTGLSQTFGHFIWNSPGQDVLISLGGLPSVTNGDFIIIDTGIDALAYSLGGSGFSLNVGGSFNSVGGVFILGSGDSDVGILDVGGDINIIDGYVQFADDQDLTVNVIGDFVLSSTGQVDFSATSASTIFNLGGDFNQTGGSLFTSGGVFNLNFIGNSVQTYTSNLSAVGTINYSVAVGSTLSIPSTNFIGGTSATSTFTMLGNLEVGSTHASGAIQTGISNGNIRVGGSRTYGDESTITYNGVGAQFIGNGHPAPAMTNVNTTISNSAGVSLATNVTISGLLYLDVGNLTLGIRTLNINDEILVDPGSTVVTSTSSNIIIGPGDGVAIGNLVTSGSATINNFSLNRAGHSLFLDSDFGVTGTFTHTAGDINFNNHTLTIGGAYTNAGATSFTSNASSSLIINGAGTITGNVPVSGVIGTLTLNRSTGAGIGSVDIASALNLVSGTLTGSIDMEIQTPTDVIETLNRADGVLAGVLSATAYNLNYLPSGNITTGPELVNGSIINFTKTGSGTLNLDKSLNIGGVFTMNGGTFNSGANILTLNGNYVKNAGTTVYTGSTINFAGNTTLLGTSQFTFPDISIIGTLNFAAATVNMTGNIDHDNGGSTVAGTSTVNFTGNTTITSNLASVPQFNNVTIGGSSALTLDCDAGCGIEPEQYGIQVAGNWNSNNFGSIFTPNPGTNIFGAQVVLNGTTQSLSTLASHIFYDLYLSGASSLTLSQALSVSNDLVIGPTSSLSTGSGNQNILLGDDFIIDGTFTANQGTVTFNGGSNQFIDQISGSNTTTFYNMLINKAGGAFTIAKNVSLQNVLFINSATPVDFDGSGSDIFTLLSTQVRTARIAPIVSPADPTLVTGSVTAQRYMDGEGKIFRYISTPVLNPQVQDLQGEIPVTGSFTGTSFPPQTGCTNCTPCTACANNNQTMFIYRETKSSNINDSYDDFPANINTETMTAGRGYSVYVREALAPTTWNLRGEINKGNQTITVSNVNGGWNLVGNPYPSSLDWGAADGAALWTRTNIDPTIYIWDNSVNNYATYNRTTFASTFGGSRYIALGQAFWVHASGAPTLVARETVKATPQTIFFRESAPSDYLRITVATDAKHKDQSLIHFNVTDATDDYDQNIDGYEFPSDTLLSIYSITSDKRRLAMNAVSSSLDCSKEIKIGLNGVKPGHVTMSFAEVESFTKPVNFYLIDNYAGTSFLIKESGSEYAFEVTTDSASFGDNRFTLVLSENFVNTEIVTKSSAICQDTNATITLEGSQKNVQYSASINGAIVTRGNGDGKTITLVIPKEQMKQGDNTVTIMAKSACGNMLPLSKTVVVNLVVLDKVVINEDGKMLTSNYNNGNQWYYNGEKIEGATDKTLIIQKPGLYKLEVTVGNCTASTERQSGTDAVTAIEDQFGISGIATIYPNPASDMVNVKVHSANRVYFNVFSDLGVKIGDTTELLNSGNDEKTGQIDLSTRSSGIYLFHIQDGEHIYTIKVLKK